MWAFLNGFGLTLSLILAIGAQNAFLLRQGLRGEHVWPLVAFCAISDALLIGVGVFGFGYLNDRLPVLAPVMVWLGAAFLLAYGITSFWRAWKGGAALDPNVAGQGSLKSALMFCAALTYLNPHVYLDTVLLIGSIGTKFDGARGVFWFGASMASLTFFVSLGFGARFLAPFMSKPRSWQILEFVIGVVMVLMAAGLVYSAV